MAGETVCVITAATKHPNLRKCIESVQQQDYPNVEHWVVADGPEWYESVDRVVASLPDRSRVQVVRLPRATGKDNWCGHRIYGAMPFLTLTSFVCFLDEDNWFDTDHVSSLVTSVVAAKARWGFSLRKIVDADGNFLMLDQCESLGTLHPAFLAKTDKGFHIDTNCYFLRWDTAILTSALWYQRGSSGPDSSPSPDLVVSQNLASHFSSGICNMKYSVNYTIASRSDRSATAEFFRHGNQAMHERYPNGLPWEKARK
jgi:glycosyltransferase involved in cell wall biosynthesis